MPNNDLTLKPYTPPLLHTPTWRREDLKKAQFCEGLRRLMAIAFMLRKLKEPLL